MTRYKSISLQPSINRLHLSCHKLMIPQNQQKPIPQAFPSFQKELSLLSTRMRLEISQYRQLSDAQCQEIIRNRIKKFYSASDQINVAQEHFKARIEPVYDKDVTASEDTLMLFGIDFLKKEQLKNMFIEFKPEIHFLDQSNCLLKFGSHEAAKEAIRRHVKKDSQTVFKVQEVPDDEEAECEDIGLCLNSTKQNELTQQQKSFSLWKECSKRWIELNPYIYRHFYKGEKKFPEYYTDYQRKLYIRYATSQQQEFNKFKNSYIDNLLNKCQKIWESEAKRNKELKNIIKQRIEIIKKKDSRKSSSFMETQSATDMKERSRSRDSAVRECSEANPDVDDEKSDRSYMMSTNKNPNLQDIVDDDLSVDIKSRSQASQIHKMIKQFSNLRCDPEENELNKSMNLSYQYFRPPPKVEVSYKVAVPSQVRNMSSTSGPFNYKQYVENSMREQMKIKTVNEIDLTDQ